MSLLQAALELSPKRRARILEAAAAEAVRPETVRRARHGLVAEPEARIRRLRREDRYNRIVRVVNLLTNAVRSVVGLDVQGLVKQLPGPFFLGERLSEPTPRTREVLSVYDQWGREIATPGGSTESRADAIPRREALEARSAYSPYVERLRKALAKRRVRDAVVRGEWLLGQERPHEAHQTFESALAADAGNAKAENGRLRASRAISASRRDRDRAWAMPRRPSPLSREEEAAERRLSRLVCHGSPGEIEAEARDFRETFALSPLCDEAAYCEIVASEMGGLRKGAVGEPSPEGGAGARWFLDLPEAKDWSAARHLRAMELSPMTNEQEAWGRTARGHRADRVRYVLLGQAPEVDGPSVFSLQDRLRRCLDPVGLLMPVQWVSRLVRLRMGHPIDDGAWRAGAVRFLQHVPAHAGALGAGENEDGGGRPAGPAESVGLRRSVALELAKSYEKMGRYADAGQWHARAMDREDPAYTARLDQRAARDLLQAGRVAPDAARRRLLLERAASRFGHTKAGRQARVELAKPDADRERQDAGTLAGTSESVRIRKADLESRPELWNGRALRLNPNWFDGRRANGELREDGVRLSGPDAGRATFTLLTADEARQRTQVLSDEARRELEPALAAWRREARARDAADELLGRPGFPFELDAAAGPGGLDFYPRLLPLPFDPERLPLYK